MRKHYTNEVKNIAMSSADDVDLDKLLKYEVIGPWWDLLDELNLTLAVSREYEHFIVLLSGESGKPHQSALQIPHPSGMYFDKSSHDLIISSTRTPNQIIWMRPIDIDSYLSDIVPTDFEFPNGIVYLPYKSTILPGSLYIHDIVLIQGELYATITGHNFLAHLKQDGGWERVWWPKLLDGMGRNAFDQNYLQLNSIAIGNSPDSSFYTAFSDDTYGPKPWKTGYGPKGKGVIFDGKSREVFYRGLTCPHSAKISNGNLWFCNSGYGEVGKIHLSDSKRSYDVLARFNGFTRGLAFSGKYLFVGLSKVIDFYEPYAPGVEPERSICGIAAVDYETGEVVATLKWPGGYQIYDVQVMPDVKRAILPGKQSEEEFNKLLRYLG